MKKPSVCFIVATPLTAHAFLRSQFEKLSTKFDIYLISNFASAGQPEFSFSFVSGFHHVNLRRKISLIRDAAALIAICRYIRRMKFDVVHTVTPKAGLIGLMAAWISGTKRRIHFFTGQVWHTRTGLSRSLLKTTDKIISRLATNILVDGFSQRDFLLKNGIVDIDKSKVLGQGTISGVDTNRFSCKVTTRESLRQQFAISKDEVVYMFLGRMNKDKGIFELISAFRKLRSEFSEVRLFLVGYDEENIKERIEKELHEGDYIFHGPALNPEDLLQVCDVFCLPSHREGFGLSVVEASACEKPVVVSDTYGLLDAVVDNSTGLKHKVGDADSLFQVMKTLYFDRSLRERLGKNGRKYVEDNFSSEFVVGEWVKFYKTIFDDVL